MRQHPKKDKKGKTNDGLANLEPWEVLQQLVETSEIIANSFGPALTEATVNSFYANCCTMVRGIHRTDENEHVLSPKNAHVINGSGKRGATTAQQQAGLKDLQDLYQTPRDPPRDPTTKYDPNLDSD